MGYFIQSVFLLALIFSSVAHASEAAYEQHIAKGISHIEENNYTDAIKEFRLALKEKPDDFKGILYLGIALSRMNDKEAEAMLRKALYLNLDDPRANLELGIHYINNSKYNEAKAYLEKAIKASDDAELKEVAEEHLALAKDEGVGKKRWAVDISLGGQYDSNVSLNPNDTPLPQGISRKADWRAVFNINSRYNFLSIQNAEGSVGYNLYQSLHSRLDDFNISYHLLDLKGSYTISPLLAVKGDYSFEYVFVGWESGHGYDYAHAVSPSLVISEGKGFYTTVEYRYRYRYFMDSSLFPSNSDRTGTTHLVGIAQDIPFKFVLTKLGYSYDKDITKKTYWDYDGHKGFINFRISLPYRILLDLYGEYYNRNYDGIDPFSGTKRKDNVYTYSASLTKELTDIFSITIGQLYIDNDSNITAYDYKRAITSLFVNARF
ncbi:MAG: hypothetical protein HZC10_03950 [Nitrospirae bacterium]|nr:hypothetical protein [Nitrospirota bacterium]